MADNPENEVKIYEPDRSLHAKTGYANLDRLLSPQAIANAETVIANSADQFLADAKLRMQEFGWNFDALRKSPSDADRLLPLMIDAAFSIKTKIGMGGYDLISALAKSLQLHCEKIKGKTPTPRMMEIIQWHINSMQQLLNGRIKGIGGASGAAILAELEHLATSDIS